MSRCGRTDKGVSAFANVISLKVRSNLKNPPENVRGMVPPNEKPPPPKNKKPEEELNYVKVLNRALPEYIRVVAWAPVDSNFSARFDCKSRSYRYFFFRGEMDTQV